MNLKVEQKQLIFSENQIRKCLYLPAKVMSAPGNDGFTRILLSPRNGLGDLSVGEFISVFFYGDWTTLFDLISPQVVRDSVIPDQSLARYVGYPGCRTTYLKFGTTLHLADIDVITATHFWSILYIVIHSYSLLTIFNFWSILLVIHS